jgi:hypothetical protein
MKIKVFGKIWNLDFVPPSVLPKDSVADCDVPVAPGKPMPGKTIRISDDLEGEYLLDTLIHELCHASQPHLNEEFVDTIATDIARCVWRPEVLRRVLNDPKAKKTVLELLSESHADS